MRYRKLFIPALAATCLIAAPANANVGTGMQTWFDSMGGYSNATPPSSYKGQTMNGYSAGGFYARTPVRTYQLAQISPPSLDIGCGGIDLHAGSFSFINKAAITALFQNIGTSISYAFLLAIKSSMPEMASLFEYLQDVANKVNGMNVNACKMTEGIPFVQGADLSKNMSAMFSHVAGSTSNMFPDSFDSWKQTKTDASAAEAAKAAAAASDPSKANYFKPGNVVWKALQNVTGIDDEDKRLIMSITGTIIITPSVPGGANGGGQPTWHYTQPTSIRVEDFIGDDPSTASTGVDVFVCDTTTDCLNPTVPATKVSITPFVKKVSTSIDALRTGITTRATQNINDFRIVDASSVPVWKLLTTSTATNQPQIVDLYKRLIAVDIAYSYFNGLIKMASQSLANAESGAVPPDAQTAIAQLQTRLSNLSTLVQTMRIAEYNKTSGEANLQRQIQLMHQAMVAGIPAQAFTSMTVFGSER